MMRRNPWIAAIASGLLATACASTSRPPTNMLVESRAAVRVAERHGALGDPEAAPYLAVARQQIAEAERLISERSYGAADRLLQHAQVNAEMAGELARQSIVRADAAQTQQEINELRTRSR